MTYNGWEDIKKMILEREKYLLVGPNVIHLQYYDGVLNEQNIEDFENKLKQVRLELSRFKYMGNNLLCSNLNKPLPKIFILVAQPLIGELINGETVSEQWETLKYLMFTIWKNLIGNNYYHNTSNEVIKKDHSFELKVNLDTNTSFSFRIQSDFNEEYIQNTFNKILIFLGEQQPNEKYKLVEYVYFDAKKEKWVKTDIQKDLLNY
jgi:hypothetical protein